MRAMTVLTVGPSPDLISQLGPNTACRAGHRQTCSDGQIRFPAEGRALEDGYLDSALDDAIANGVAGKALWCRGYRRRPGG
jgi:hypothetical protein